MRELGILKATRKRLEDPGSWGQGRYRNQETGQVCLMGALGEACGSSALREIVAAEEALEAMVGGLSSSISPVEDWNDVPGRTHAEVLTLLDDVIAKLEEQEAGAPLPPLTTGLHPSERSPVAV